MLIFLLLFSGAVEWLSLLRRAVLSISHLSDQLLQLLDLVPVLVMAGPNGSTRFKYGEDTHPWRNPSVITHRRF